MKAKKLVLLLDAIIIAIVTMAMLTGTAITKTGLNAKNKMLAENSDLSFNLIADPEETRVKAGATVDVTLSAKDINIGKEGLNSIVGYLSYDESLFDSVEINAEKDWNIELNQRKGHSMYGKFCIYTMQEGVTEDQVVVRMKMKLKDDLKPQTTKVYFTELASSDGEVEVPEEDRVVTIIIYEDGVPEDKKDPPVPVKTVDNKILVVIAIAILTIILNILTFAKNKKAKVVGTILVAMLGLSSLGIATYAAEGEINVAEVLNRLSYRESWLNSEKYLVTAENISRVAPGTKVEAIKNQFNKNVVITKNGQEVADGTVLGTGMKVSVKNPSKADAEGDYAYELSVYGDTNGDGKSNQVELTRIIRNTVDEEKWNLTGVKKISADLTVDNKVDEKDVNPSVMYIVYGEMEIPEFDPVEEPTIEVIEGTFDEEDNCYTTDVKVKITEKAENGIITQYKVENSKGMVTEYTEISREVTEDGKIETIIELPKDEIYKVSAYTTGELGNRSGIPYLIVNGVFNNLRKYKVEYYYRSLEDEETDTYKIDNSKTVEQYAEIGSEITTYEEKVKPGYEKATEKGTNGVEGLPLTINRNETNNVIKVYYKLHHYSITYDPNGGTWPNGGNPNPGEYTIETPIITVIDPGRVGYEITGWTEEEGQTPVKPYKIQTGKTGDIEIKAQWTPIVYRITYNGITDEERAALNNPTTYTIEDEKIINNPEDRETETFEGWSGTDLTGNENKAVKIERGSIGNREYTAHWVEKPAEPHTVTAEVVGGHGTVAPTSQVVDHGANVNNLEVTPEDGYMVSRAMVYSGPKDESRTYDPENDTDGTQLRAGRKGSNGKIKLATINNITEDKHVVVKLKVSDSDVIAMIIAVPSDNETLANLASDVDGEPILNHEYETLEDALIDALKTNEKRDELGLTGKVKILILTDIDGENNRVTTTTNPATDNEVIIDLNGKTVSSSDSESATIEVQDGASLQIVDESSEDDGKVLNTLGPAIVIKEKGELTLGTNNQRISYTAPVIEGKNNGIIKEAGDNEGVFNFYDGKIIGDDAALSGSSTVNDTPVGYKYSLETGERKVATLQINNEIEAMIGKTTYIRLEDAFARVNNNEEWGPNDEIEIDVVRPIIDIDNQAVVLNANKNVKLDLNGHTIRPNNDEGTIKNKGKLTVIDSTKHEDGVNYQEFVKSDNAQYEFVKENNYYRSNNSGVASSTADSYIVLDLRYLDESSENTVTVNANISSQGNNNDYGYAIITESKDVPQDLTNAIFKISGTIIPADYSKTINGGKLYYLHVGYVKNASEDVFLDQLVINDITVNNQEMLEDASFGTGKITGKILNQEGAQLILDGGSVEIVRNDGSFSIKGGTLRGPAVNLNENASIDITNGIASYGSGPVSNNPKGSITISDNARVYGGYVSSGRNFERTIGPSQGTLTITGGLVYCAGKNLISTATGNVSITGGTFVTNEQGIATQNTADNTIVIEGTENNPIKIYSGSNAAIIYDTKTNDKELTIKNIDIKSNTTGIHGIGKVNLVNNNVVAGGAAISVGEGEVNIVSGYYEGNTYAVSSPGTVIIGTKNDESNTEISTTNPKIYGHNLPIYSYSGTTGKAYFYDGIIVGKADSIDNYYINGIEEEDAQGNPMQIVIEDYTDAGMKQMTLQKATDRIARISKSYASKVNVSGIKYEEDDNYYYFNRLDLAIDSCNADNNNVVIEIIKDGADIENITISDNKNITLNLNGNTLKMHARMTINENATFEITNNSENGKLSVVGATNQNNSYNNGKLIIRNANYDNPSGTYYKYIVNNGEMDVDGGTVGAVFNYSKLEIYNNGTVTFDQKTSEDTETAVTHITSGTLIGSARNGIINIDSGTSAEKTNVTFNGGVLGWVNYGSDGEVNINNVNLNTSLTNIGTIKMRGKTTISNSVINDNVEIEGNVGNRDRTITNSIIKGGLKCTDADDNSGHAVGGDLNITNCTIGEQGKNVEVIISHRNREDNPIDITNTTIYGSLSTSPSYTYIDGYDNVQINNGTRIICTNGAALKGTGTTIIGTKDGNISTESPYLEGVDATITNSETKYYDGVIVTHHSESGRFYKNLSEDEKAARIEEIKQGAINNTRYIREDLSFIEIEDSVIPVSTSETVVTESAYDNDEDQAKIDVTKTTILGKTPVAKVLKTNCNITDITSEDYTDLGEYYGFYRLEKAINSCKDNVQADVILLEDISINDNTKVLNATSNKKINMDLAGKTVTITVPDAITNSGEFAISDSSSNSEGIIYFNGEKLIENTGKFSINGGSIMSKNYTNLLSQITNKNELTINTPGEINAGVYNYPGNTKLKILNCNSSMNVNGDYGTVLSNTLRVTSLSTRNDAIEMSGGAVGFICSLSGKASITGGKIGQIFNGYTDYEIIEDSPNNTYTALITSKSGILDGTSSSVNEKIIRIYDKDYTSGGATLRRLFIPDGSINNLSENIPNAEMSITGDTNIVTSVSNNGTMNININGTTSARIVNKGDHNMNITGGTFTGAIVNAGFKDDASGESAKWYIEGQSTGNLVIKDATITGGIINNGILTLGDNSNSVTNTPEVNSKIQNYPNGTFNYYDGVLTAINETDDPVYGGITAVATNTQIKSEKVEGKTQFTLVPVENDMYKVEVNGTTTYKGTLQDAIDLCTTNNSTNPDKITIMKDVLFIENGVVSDNQNIVFDLNGKTIKGKTNGSLFDNSGTLEIKDSTATADTAGDGYINGYFNKVIDNKGTLTLSGGNIRMQTPDAIVTARYTIINSGTITFNGVNIEVVNNGAIDSQNGDALYFNKGSVKFKYDSAYSRYGIRQMINVAGTSLEDKTIVIIKDDFKFGWFDNINGSYSPKCFVCTYADINVEGESFADWENGPYSQVDSMIINYSDLTLEEGAKIVGTKLKPIQYQGPCVVNLKRNSEIIGLVRYQYITISLMDLDLTINEAKLGKLEFSGKKAVLNDATVTGEALFTNEYVGNNQIASSINNISISGGTYGKMTAQYNATMTINGVNITKEGLGVSSGSNVTLLNSRVISEAGTAVSLYGGASGWRTTVLKIGTNETGMPDIDVLNPHCEGGQYGISVSYAKLYVYDGHFIGGTAAINIGSNGQIICPSYNGVNYTPVYEDSENKRAHIGVVATVDNKMKIGSTEYDMFSGALEFIDTLPNKKATIEMLKTVYMVDPVTIPAGYDVTIDLKGQLISSYNEAFIVEQGAKLTIIDDTDTGEINSSTKEAIVNNGTLIIGKDGDGVVNIKSPLIKGRTYAITNNGTLNMYDGILKSIETGVISGNAVSGKPAGYNVQTGTQVINEVTYSTMYLGQ